MLLKVFLKESSIIFFLNIKSDFKFYQIFDFFFQTRFYGLKVFFFLFKYEFLFFILPIINFCLIYTLIYSE